MLEAPPLVPHMHWDTCTCLIAVKLPPCAVVEFRGDSECQALNTMPATKEELSPCWLWKRPLKRVWENYFGQIIVVYLVLKGGYKDRQREAFYHYDAEISLPVSEVVFSDVYPWLITFSNSYSSCFWSTSQSLCLVWIWHARKKKDIRVSVGDLHLLVVLAQRVPVIAQWTWQRMRRANKDLMISSWELGVPKTNTGLRVDSSLNSI